MRTTLYPSAALAALLLLSSSAAAGTRYVNGVLATGNNDGTSWADAYRGVDAVAVALTASVAGDEIWVAAGTYKPTTTATRTISHQLKAGVAVYGGFNGTETLLSQRDYLANVTILSGDIGTAGSNTDNSHHVVVGAGTTANTILDGFTVTQGNANVGSANNDRGGGILCLAGASPSVRNCRFVDNRCTFGGGAGYVLQSSPSFVNTSFENNVGGSFGGAFDTNTTSTTWDRCTFIGNTAARAGAVECFTTGTPRILNCLFRDNVSTGSGGGGAIWSSSTTQIRNCTIVENSSTTNATAGILVSGGGATIANCIVVDNSGPGGAQGVVNQIAGTTAVTYSIVEGGFAGTGNLNVSPAFANQAGNDFALTIASPAIDAGNNASVIAGFTLDLAGKPRFADEPTVADTGAGVAPIVDIGAYEFPAPVVTAFCFGDGTATLCPCGNDAPFFSGTGCLNSLGTGGLLGSTGSARILGDTFAVVGSGMPNSSCLYFQGTTQVNGGNGSVFGDGIRCAGGSVIRLGTKTNSAGASQYPVVGDLSISVKGLVTLVGTVRTYQCWYRNAAAFCTADTFNLTNGLSVTWEL
ncbi:MAG: right-handed parallel beta-helix repeat-containing protein [Planctomycetota bacterium]|nr:right-handed parallel beta-helix repeat-containing protein [Planctomycetota bacterium]